MTVQKPCTTLSLLELLLQRLDTAIRVCNKHYLAKLVLSDTVCDL